MSSLSIAELETKLKQQQKRIENLLIHRKKLLDKVQEIETEIESLIGKDIESLIRKMEQENQPVIKNEKPLIDYVKQILKRRKNGLPLREIAEKVISAGYQSNSKNFKNVLYQCVYHSEEITCEEGLYSLCGQS